VVRALIAATITRPGGPQARPGLRFGLIDNALAPLADSLGATDPAALEQLKRDLAVVVSAEALFSLTDLHDLGPDDAVASLVHTATTLTRAALREHAAGDLRPAAPAPLLRCELAVAPASCGPGSPGTSGTGAPGRSAGVT
jgi:hypothetical protein